MASGFAWELGNGPMVATVFRSSTMDKVSFLSSMCNDPQDRLLGASPLAVAPDGVAILSALWQLLEKYDPHLGGGIFPCEGQTLGRPFVCSSGFDPDRQALPYFCGEQWGRLIQGEGLSLGDDGKGSVLECWPLGDGHGLQGVLLLQTTVATGQDPAFATWLPILRIQMAIALRQIQHQEENGTAAAGFNACAFAQEQQLISTVSHELRTPLGSIIGMAQMLLREIYGQVNPKQREYLEIILRSGTYLKELINNWLDLAKLDAHKIDLEWETFAIAPFAQEIIQLMTPQNPGATVELRLNLAQDTEQIHSDRLKIKQILINLLSNSLKFTEKGTITLTIRQDAHHVYFSVEDTGMGIDPEDQPKLFQPFQQLNNQANPLQKGTGLGLVLCEKLAQLLQGEIVFWSQRGQGSCFTLKLPRESDRPTEIKKERDV